MVEDPLLADYILYTLGGKQEKILEPDDLTTSALFGTSGHCYRLWKNYCRSI